MEEVTVELGFERLLACERACVAEDSRAVGVHTRTRPTVVYICCVGRGRAKTHWARWTRSRLSLTRAYCLHKRLVVARRESDMDERVAHTCVHA